MSLDKIQIARQFSRAAKTYDAVSQLQVEMSDRLLKAIPTTTSGHLVDLGCGTGRSLTRLAELGRFDLTGIDIAPGMIDVAKTRVPSCIFHCGDLENTPLDDHSMDVVFSNAAIQWCDCESAIGEMMRIARPKGIVVASTFGPGTLHQWRSVWQSIDAHFDRIHSFQSRQAMENAFGEAGFDAISVSQVIREFQFDSVDSMFLSIRKLGATNAMSNRSAAMLGRNLYQQVRSEFERQLNQTGKLTLSFDCIFVTATKPSR